MEGFKRSVYCNKCKINSNRTYAENEYIRELLDSSYQGVKRLFALAYDNTNGITADSHRRYFTDKASAGVMIYYILEQSKETMLRFSKRTTKVF